MKPQETIEAFTTLVAKAEAAADRKPRADLATYQLQGLATSLGQLAPDGDYGDAVSNALTVLRDFVAEHGGVADELEGRALRTKVAAYATVAEDLGLDGNRCDELVRRWDAATAPRDRASAPPRGRAPRPAAAGAGDGEQEPCPLCGKSFKRLKMHLTVAHRGEAVPEG